MDIGLSVNLWRVLQTTGPTLHFTGDKGSTMSDGADTPLYVAEESDIEVEDGAGIPFFCS
jgi:hypothetical protein